MNHADTLTGQAKLGRQNAGSTPKRYATDDQIDHAVAMLRRGELVGFPTETVYGLGAHARMSSAVARVFALKGRPTNHPLIVHIAEGADMQRWTADLPDSAWRLARAFWPGPLTLVLRKHASVPDAVTGGQDSIALRVPAHPMAQALLRALGDGIAAPSANRYGRISPTAAEHVRDEFGPQLGLVLDGGRCELGLESTIVSCLTDPPRVLRPGSIGLKSLTAALGRPLSVPSTPDSKTPRVPGQSRSHYAPTAPLTLVSGEELLCRLDNQHDLQTGILASRPPPAALAPTHRWLAMPRTAAAYGHHLYAALRVLDAAHVEQILVETPPDTASWRAIHDRLERAAAPQPRRP